MSVKNTILALLYKKERHGYEVITGFNELVQKQWQLNPGQVYTTLDRLERDLLVESLGEDIKGRTVYSITEIGKEAFLEWLRTPVKRPLLKDEFYFKWLCAQENHSEELYKLIQSQKDTIIKQIFFLTQLKLETKESNFKKIIHGGLLHLEADLKWLEYIEE
ncbi:PadR family transcriptional regulator [Peribacillus simplex]|uniref:PadR family transcriptional regulator n=1 Tax=Peribacillus simplex TaxID=1478 RepID=UPI003D27270C